MSIAGDGFDDALVRLAKEGELDRGKEAVLSLVAGIPYAGSAISSLLTGGATRRVVERVEEVFQAVKERLETVEETQIDKAYFESDEFMTILILAIEQVQTTHDKKTLRMIASALANSGTVKFSSDSRKELFMRIMRDLAPEHISMLATIRLSSIVFEQKNPTGERLTVLQNLAAHGLMEESYEKVQRRIPHNEFTNQREAAKAIAEMIAAPTIHRFRLSKCGADFLEFFDSPETVATREGSIRG